MAKETLSAIAHRLGVCYCYPEDVEERIIFLRKKYGNNYIVKVGKRNDFEHVRFAYHSLEAAIEEWSPEIKRQRIKREQREYQNSLMKKIGKRHKHCVCDVKQSKLMINGGAAIA